MKKLPAVGRIEGVRFQAHATSNDPKHHLVELQYSDPAQGWHSLTMPFLDALYLLNLLDDLATQTHSQHLRRPPQGPGH